ncbi:hypothetical protein [Aurantimonas coralicida]|uniref:hypothetical protein n=1 Tax=Aurantimonas coralicida TaxID=182270 RepID=UPI0004626C68|nr:hypothetical protein [Aurantimonas coralicida]
MSQTTPTVSKRGRQNVRAAFADAQRRLADQAVSESPDPNLPRHIDGKPVKAGEWIGAPWDAMPPECPVTVLGHNGGVTYCVSAAGQMHDVERWDQTVIAKLFAPHFNYAMWAWPGFGKVEADDDGNPRPPKVKRLERDKAAVCLIQEGARRGLFDPSDRVRGRGGWIDKSGRFVWHSGEYLWTIEGKKLMAARPGELDGYLYTRSPDVQRPYEDAVDADTSPAGKLLGYLRTWSWERPGLDPFLFLGWIVTAYMGGALAWRPSVFTTGGAGVGKSTLHGVIARTFDRSLHATADTTAAGIYQRVKQDSLPVTVDELENKPGSNKAQAVVELARLAASGAALFRGGADHEGTSFQARNCFLFSAINPPPLGAQDKSRMAILNLSKLDQEKKALSLDLSEADGPMILRQVMQGWSRFASELLPDWKRALHDAGMDSRAQDTYGTLLAAAQLVVGDEAMASDLLDVTEMTRTGVAIARETTAERAEQMDNWQQCLEHLFGSTIDNWKSGERPTIGAVIEDLMAGSEPLDYDNARARLASAGLGLRKTGDPCEGFALAVPSSGPQLAKIFGETEWRGGVWTGALKQAPHAIIWRNGEKRVHNVKINGSTKWCVLVDLKAYQALSTDD